MAADDIEHQAEIRSSGARAPALVVLLALVGVVVALVVRAGDDGPHAATPPPAPPSTPTSETLTTTRPPAVEVLAVTDVGGGPVPVRATSDRVTRRPPIEATFEALQATPIAVDGQVVALADGGRLLAGTPGEVFEPFGPEGPVSEVVASNEPRHVWARVTEAELALVRLDGGEPRVRIPVGDDRVLGPASFGVVTVGPEGTWWRRPSFDPTPVLLPGDRQPLDAGGDLVLVEAPEADERLRRFETWSIVDGRAVQTFLVRRADRPALISPDGTTVALPERRGFAIRDATSGAERGELPPSAIPGAAPVWVGGHHFAVAAGAHVVLISDSIRHRPRWPVSALAEASPSASR
ncbi:MAG: hypothetical protein ACLGIC_10980 [Acidimicrobiia bacterium]